MLQKVELGSTLCNMLLQLATRKFVARQVERKLVIRETTRLAYNATMLLDKLNKNVPMLPGLKALLKYRYKRRGAQTKRNYVFFLLFCLVFATFDV